ncbi:hypothetical protein EYF80_036766 [Liparis tanakae]|uniref:Uncharacterized protein n=1 Tax=Liparis tanakae TaxID=230148 RepID=A0A4Z2GIG3_9TELE|nr:hypothetical protein EYF80_036766 [Liparis tanakae]
MPDPGSESQIRHEYEAAVQRWQSEEYEKERLSQELDAISPEPPGDECSREMDAPRGAPRRLTTLFHDVLRKPQMFGCHKQAPFGLAGVQLGLWTVPSAHSRAPVEALKSGPVLKSDNVVMVKQSRTAMLSAPLLLP